MLTPAAGRQITLVVRGVKAAFLQALQTGANAAVLTGGAFLKIPQLVKIQSSRSVEGISEVSLLLEVRLTSSGSMVDCVLLCLLTTIQPMNPAGIQWKISVLKTKCAAVLSRTMYAPFVHLVFHRSC